MEDLSYYAFLSGFIFASVAAAAYLVPVLGTWTACRPAATDAGTVSIPVSITLPTGAERFARAFLYVALACLTLAIASRAVAVERPPVGNLWEYTIALGWGMVLFTVIFERAFQERAVPTVMLPAAVGLMAVALAFFPSEIRPLVPALQSNRILGIHVTTMVLAYSALSISFGASLLYLLQISARRTVRLPDPETLSEVAYWSVLVGFPLLTLGVALGAYWANNAWGRYWGWDPKETASFITWLVYAGYLHARGLRGWEGKRAAYLLLIGYGAVLFTYFAVNFLISGLHSYAGV